MKDSTFDRLVTVLGIVAGLYWFLKGSPSSGALPPTGVAPIDPNLVNYMATTGGQPIAMAGAPNVQINVANQTAQFLSNAYIPMFGMVGVAQGQMYP